MALRVWWQKAERRFAAYSLRERALLGLAILVGIALLGSTVLIEPEAIRVRALTQTLQVKEGEVVQLRSQSAALQARAALDPDVALRQELATAQQRLQDANATLLQANAAMVPAARMNEILDRILTRQKGLRLVSMRSLEPVAFIDKPTAGTGDAKVPATFEIYRHGVEVVLSGNYAELYGYLRQLEAEKQKFLWGEMRIRVKEYPNAEMTLVLHTLSMDKVWLTL